MLGFAPQLGGCQGQTECSGAGQMDTCVRQQSPEWVAHLSQNRLMPLLIDAATSTVEFGRGDDASAPLCSIEHNIEVTSLETTPIGGVVATVKNCHGVQEVVRSSYAIACAPSPVLLHATCSA